MVDWRVKGLVQKVLGYTPGGQRIHYLLQRRSGGLAHFARECELKFADWQLMMGHLRTSSVPLSGAALLEMGTGWYPTFPIALVLAGARRVVTLDLVRHVRAELTVALLEWLASRVPQIAAESGREAEVIEADRIRILRALRGGAALAEATDGAVVYRAPADACATGLPEASIDVVFSNSVLEHVPGPVIEACMREAHRILVPGGIMVHSVNCGDHYAYVDRRIDQLHYLTYSEAAWTKWNNAFLYQNRLRAEDFLRFARHAGFAIEIDTSRANPIRLAQLAKIQVDPCFRHYTQEQLAITSVDFAGRKLR